MGMEQRQDGDWPGETDELGEKADGMPLRRQ